MARFQSALDDDLNTAAALVVLFELAKSSQREVNLRTHQAIENLSDRDLDMAWQTLRQLDRVLGLEASQPTASSLDLDLDLDLDWVETLLRQRQAARQEKRYAESDRLKTLLPRRARSRKSDRTTTPVTLGCRITNPMRSDRSTP